LGVPHAPGLANFNGKPVVPPGLTISPQSKLTAADLVAMIKKSLPSFFASLFHANRNRIVVWEGGAIPAGVTIPEWFDNARYAVNSGVWHLTTGTVNIDDATPAPVGQKLAGDYEDGDLPIGGKRETGIFVGDTIPTMPQSTITLTERVTDENAGGGPKSLLRRPVTDKLPGESLIVLGTRFRDVAHGGPEIPRSDSAIVETFFHELAAHAYLFNEGKDASHSIGNGWKTSPVSVADVVAQAVYLYFGSMDETPLINQATVNKIPPDGGAGGP